MVDDELRSDVDKILRWFRGNGEPGLFERQRDVEARQDRVEHKLTDMQHAANETKSTLERLIKERNDSKAEWRGMKRAIYLIAAILGLMGAGGYASLVQLLNKIASAP